MEAWKYKTQLTQNGILIMLHSLVAGLWEKEAVSRFITSL